MWCIYYQYNVENLLEAVSYSYYGYSNDISSNPEDNNIRTYVSIIIWFACFHLDDSNLLVF